MAKNNLSVASLTNLMSLLQKEYEYEKSGFIDACKFTGIDNRIKNGMCWYPTSIGDTRYNSVNQCLVYIKCQKLQNEDHLFEPGIHTSFFI